MALAWDFSLEWPPALPPASPWPLNSAGPPAVRTIIRFHGKRYSAPYAPLDSAWGFTESWAFDSRSHLAFLSPPDKYSPIPTACGLLQITRRPAGRESRAASFAGLSSARWVTLPPRSFAAPWSGISNIPGHLPFG